MNTLLKSLLIASSLALFAGCSSSGGTAGDGSADGAAGAGTYGAGRGSAFGGGAGGGAGGAGGYVGGPGANEAQRVVYFDFDSSDIRADSRPLIEAHAQYLTQNPGAAVVLEGHTDERGSREYNIALGQKRADSVKRMMTLLGAQDAQIETVSFGKEKPKNPGHDEASWAENRRDDLVYAGE